MSGIGTSKEDKRRKRRSLPYEKKPQADKARIKKRIKTIIKKATKAAVKGATMLPPPIGGFISALKTIKTIKNNKKKYGTQGYGKARKP